MLNISEHKILLPAITNAIVDSYKETPSTHHLDTSPLPRAAIVAEILDDLKEILYPGFRNRERLDSFNVEYFVGSIVDRLHYRLTALVERALTHTQQENHTELPPDKQHDIQQEAEQKTLDFLGQIPAIRRKLAKDVEAVYAGDPACKSSEEAVLCYPSVEAVTVHRIAHAFFVLGVPLIPRMMSEYAHSITGIDIHPGAAIGEYFFIDHGTGVVIGETTVIGNWVKLYQGVTLGAKSFKTDENGELDRTTKRHPTIEDNVVIYANATILGGNTVVGKDAIVGSSVWLTCSLPPGTMVMNNKTAPVIRYKNSENEFFEAFDWRI